MVREELKVLLFFVITPIILMRHLYEVGLVVIFAFLFSSFFIIILFLYSKFRGHYEEDYNSSPADILLNSLVFIECSLKRINIEEDVLYFSFKSRILGDDKSNLTSLEDIESIEISTFRAFDLVKIEANITIYFLSRDGEEVREKIMAGLI